MKNVNSIKGKIDLAPLLAGVSFFYFLLGSIQITDAGNIISTGTTFKCKAGTSIVSSESFTIKNGAALNNDGTLFLKKDLVNQNPSSNSIGNGTVICCGTIPQALFGNSNIQHLTINNTAGVTNGGNNRVNGVLTLTSGLVTLGDNHLTLGSGATIAGTPSATAMLVPTGLGQVRKKYPGIGSFTFPVGDNTVTAEYSPVTLLFTAGTFPGDNYVGVNLVNDHYPGSPVSGSFLKRYWNVVQSGITPFSCNATFQYVPADVIGIESQIYFLRITPTTVTYHNAANTTLHQIWAQGITYFGTFTGFEVLADKSLNLTLLLEGLYNGGGTMRKAQNYFGGYWFPGNTADQVRIQLHDQASYYHILYEISIVNLSTSGNCSVAVPGIFSDSYYVTILHRNSIETTTASPLSFTSSSVSYNYSNSLAQAYGNNLKNLGGGFYGIYAGDITSIGIIDNDDMAAIFYASNAFLIGYLLEDINGDGIVDGLDIVITDNNIAAFIQAILPP